MESIVFNLIVDHFGTDYLFWTLYILNIIFSFIAFKLGFARELPLLKSILVYILLAFGVFVITVFSILRYPMTESLIIISIVLGVYRLRLHQERTRKNEQETESK